MQESIATACAIGDTRPTAMSPSVVSMTKTVTTLTCCLAVAGAVALGAQSSETTTKTKIEVESGKKMKVAGCVEKNSKGAFVLTRVTDKTGALHSYMLVSDDEDFSKVIGHRVQIEGTAADRNGGKVEIETETKVDGPTKDTHSKTEGSGPYLGVKHMKSIAGSCN
jgi:hypothetical protein